MKVKCNLKSADDFGLRYGEIYTVQSEITYKGSGVGFDYYILNDIRGYKRTYLKSWFDVVSDTYAINWDKVMCGTKVVFNNTYTGEKEHWYFVKVANCKNLMLSQLSQNDLYSGLKMDHYKLCKFVNPVDVEIHDSEIIQESWMV